MHSWRVACTALAWIALAPGLARADFYFHSWDDHVAPEKATDLSVTFGAYQSKANYDSTGATFTPNGLASYSRMISDIELAFGVSSRLSLYGRLDVARVAVDHPTQGGDQFGLGDQSAGLSFRLVENKLLRLDLQAQADFPGYTNEGALASVPLLGDATSDFTFGAFARIPIKAWELGGGAGYTYRTGGFSAAVPWRVWAAYNPGESGFGGQLGLAGLASLKTDTTVDPTLDLSGGHSTGGSFAANAVNPSLLNFRPEVAYQVNRNLGLALGAQIAMAGQSAPQGTLFFASLRMRWGDPVTLAREYSKSNQGFVNYAFEAKITRVSDRLNLVKINKGSQDGVVTGQVLDIFSVGKDGRANEAVARAKVTSVHADEAALTITEYFREVWIEEGFLVKRPLE